MVISGVGCDEDDRYEDCGRETTLPTAYRQDMVSKRWLLVEFVKFPFERGFLAKCLL
jgi:hypothetical protein